MRQPSILNVLRAVRQVGPAHPEVRAWWYAPARRLRLHGALPEGEGDAVEVVVELDLQGADLAAIGGEIAQSLRSGPVSVRPHRGADEERQLYRLLSRGKLVRVG
jgi:hypothetical protein